MGEHFQWRKRQLFFENLKGFNSNNQYQFEYRKQFNNLHEHEKMKIDSAYKEIQLNLSTSFLFKLQQSALLLLWKLPFFFKAWLALSIIISVLYLLRHKRAHQYIWILPILLLLQGVYQIRSSDRVPTNEEKLFPTEQQLIASFLDKPLSSSLRNQYHQLIDAWHRYIITVWLNETPSKNNQEFAKQLANANWMFDLQRAKCMQIDWNSTSNNKWGHLPIIIYILLLAWNLLLAFRIWASQPYDRKYKHPCQKQIKSQAKTT